jgi:hypothetical protein
MLYAVLCYHSEDVVTSWSADHEQAVMGKLAAVEEKLAKAGRLGPVARLLPTTAATTLRKDQDPPLVIDGPFAETKEQLLGFFIIDVERLTETIETARELARALKNWTQNGPPRDPAAPNIETTCCGCCSFAVTPICPRPNKSRWLCASFPVLASRKLRVHSW